MKARTLLNIAVLFTAFIALQVSHASPPQTLHNDINTELHAMPVDALGVYMPSLDAVKPVAVLPSTLQMPETEPVPASTLVEHYDNSRKLQELKYDHNGRDKI